MTAPLYASNINDKTAAHLARASTEIVKLILKKGHLTDMCITFINHPTKSLEMWEHYKEVMNQCKEILKADLLPGTTQAYSLTRDLGRNDTLPLPDTGDWEIITPGKNKPRGDTAPSSASKPTE